jgi:hypothetical protein
MTTTTKILTQVPHYYQSEYDYACGPMAVRMVADYYFKLHKKREMTASEWLQILDLTMCNNIWRKTGTRKKDIIRALEMLSLKAKLIDGDDFYDKYKLICKSIYKNRPVIIYCVIRPDGKPYRHFAVVVGVYPNGVYVRDPYPRKRKTKHPRKIGNNVFKNPKPKRGQLVWGRVQWAVEVNK